MEMKRWALLSGMLLFALVVRAKTAGQTVTGDGHSSSPPTSESQLATLGDQLKIDLVPDFFTNAVKPLMNHAKKLAAPVLDTIGTAFEKFDVFKDALGGIAKLMTPVAQILAPKLLPMSQDGPEEVVVVENPQLEAEIKKAYDSLSSFLKEEAVFLGAAVDNAAQAIKATIKNMDYHSQVSSELTAMLQQFSLPPLTFKIAEQRARYRNMKRLCQKLDKIEDIFRYKNTVNCATSTGDVTRRLLKIFGQVEMKPDEKHELANNLYLINQPEALKYLDQMEKTVERELRSANASRDGLPPGKQLFAGILNHTNARIKRDPTSTPLFSCMPQVVMATSRLSQEEVTNYMKLVNANTVQIMELATTCYPLLMPKLKSQAERFEALEKRMADTVASVAEIVQKGMNDFQDMENLMIQQTSDVNRKLPLESLLIELKKKMHKHGPYGMERTYIAVRADKQDLYTSCPQATCGSHMLHSQNNTYTTLIMTIRYTDRSPSLAENTDFYKAAISITRKMPVLEQFDAIFRSKQPKNYLDAYTSQRAGFSLTNDYVKHWIAVKVNGTLPNEFEAVALEPGTEKPVKLGGTEAMTGGIFFNNGTGARFLLALFP